MLCKLICQCLNPTLSLYQQNVICFIKRPRPYRAVNTVHLDYKTNKLMLYRQQSLFILIYIENTQMPLVGKMQNSCLNLELRKVTSRPAALVIAVFRDDWPHHSSVLQAAFLPQIRSVSVLRCEATQYKGSPYLNKAMWSIRESDLYIHVSVHRNRFLFK